MGALDTKWFEALTVEALAGTDSDQDELCANQESNFKTPFEKSAADSQMFSTPKVFRYSQTPEADNDTAKEERETLLWTAASPCQMTKERMTTAKSYAVLHSPDSFDLPHTLNKYPDSAISWTSSLNTPPPVQSTLILSRKDESSSTVTLTEDKNDFVRKFQIQSPSVSNASRNMAMSLKNNVSLVQEDGIHTEDNAELNESFQTWRQMLPDTTEDVEVCSTVASGLHGAENALSIFFTNSISVSRKVKNERVKKKQIIPLKQNGCDAVEFSPTNTVLSEDNVKEPNSASVQPTGHIGITQWSPLSLSEIHETSCCNKAQVKNGVLTEQSLRKTISGLQTDLKKSSKKGHFLYTVGSSKSQATEMNCQTKTLPPSISLTRQIDKSNNGRVSEGDHVQNMENVTREESLDILQLSTTLAKDFSQKSELVKLSTVTEDALHDGFSPLACLSALKRAKQNANVESHDCEDISDRELISAFNQSTINDSGFQYVSTSNQLQFEMDTTANVPLPNLENEQELNKTKCPSNPVNINNFSGRNCDSRFNTASNTILHISTGSIDKARDFFDDNCHLTASQKADVKQLCSFFEESSTQFEFTQFKTANMNCECQTNGTASPKSDKEPDPDFLNGIDFNDSLSSVTEKPFPVTCEKSTPISEVQTQQEMSNCESKSTVIKKRHSSTPFTCTYASPSISNEIIQERTAKDNTKQPYSKPPENDQLHNTKRFVAASGKEVAISIEARQKAKSLLDDICFTVDTPVVPSKRKNTENKGTTRSGFTEVGLRNVHFSHPRLQKVRKDGDSCEYLSAQPPEKESAAKEICLGSETREELNLLNQSPVSNEHLRLTDSQASFPTKHNKFHTSNNIKRTILPVSICEKPTVSDESRAIFEGATSGNSTVSETRKTGETEVKNLKIIQCGFTTKVHGGKKNIEKVKHLWKDFDDAFFNNTKGLPLTKGDRNVANSTSAFKKSKWLSKSENREDKSIFTQSHSKLAINDSAPRTRGFQSASGKLVAVSAEALQKAMALFDDLSFKAEDLSFSEVRETAENTETIQSDFTTAGGTKVHIAKKNIENVKSLWNDFEKDCHISCSNIEQLSETSTSNLVSSDGNGLSVSDEAKQLLSVQISKCDRFQTVPGRAVSIPSAALKKAKRLFNEFEDAKDQILKVEVNDAPLRTSGFLSATSKPVAISAKALKKAKTLFGGFSAEALAISGKRTTENTQCGFTTEGGTKVHVAKKIIEKVKNPCNVFEKDCPELSSNLEHPRNSETNLAKKHLNQTALNFISSSGKSFDSGSGFCTASGKTVKVSDKAMSEANELLSENQKDINLQLKPHLNSFPPQSNGYQTAEDRRVVFSSAALNKAKQLLHENGKVAVSEPFPGTSGFQVASGKPVAISSTALQKAMALFDDIGFTAEILAGSETRETGNTKSNAATIQHSFTLTRADVAEKNVKIYPFTSNLNPPVKMDMLTKGVNHSLTKETVPLIPLEFHKEKIVFSEANHNESTEGKKSNRVEKHCSVLSLESANLSCCTATQQKFLAQEALDCTMALLEDEVRTAQSLAVSSENIHLQCNPITYSISVERQNRIGKRQVEDENTTDQLPPKRQLLEEFDRTLDGPKGSTLYPAKSCPNGLFKDRRVFQYSIILHPNITRPHGSGKHYIENKLQKGSPPSAPTNSRTANTKTSVFVPPFLNNTRTQAQKNSTQKDKGTTSTFVPPFKKHKMDVQEHYTTAQEEDSVTSSNTNPFVPPSRKSPNTMDISNSKGKHNIQRETLPAHTSENPAKIEIPRAYGTDKTAAEKSQETDIAHCQETIENLENIQLARKMQDIRIRKKKTIQPLPGSLFLTKTSQVARVTLRTAVNGETPQKYTQKQLYEYGVHQQWSAISSETAKSFRFNLLNFHKQEALTEAGGVQLADGGWLIPRNDGTAGKEEFYKALCDTPGVDPKLLGEEWVYNHYRWVVWKLVSMERSFPATMGSRCLTPEQVLLQLKYRYDIEVDQSRRPALRKIMEKDDTAAKTLVLCVCGVIFNGRLSPRTPQDVSANPENPWAVVVLTDGWYAIKAQLDEPLTAMLHKGQIAVGVKIMIHGAQMVGSQDACVPLEAPESLMLKICANSTRRVRWDTKLGFHRDPRPFLLPVSSLFSNGGLVGLVDIVVLRSYPIQWMERKPDGGVVFRSARAEEKEARRYNCHKQKTMETLYAKIEAEFENEEKGKMKSRHRRRTMEPEAFAKLQDGEELYEAVGDDLAYVEVHFSEEQLETLGTYRRTLMDQRKAELQNRYHRALEDAETKGSCPKRDVTTMWRLCVADSLDQTGSSVHQLSIWKPSSDLQSLLKEGCRYKVYNLTTSWGKKQGGSRTVQLVSTKKTQFQDLQDSQEWLSAHFHPRVCVSFAELKNPDFKPLCGEVDLTGFVISVIDEHSLSPAFYLVDMSLNFVKVRSFVSFSQSGWEDLVKLHGLLALSNLQLRGQSLSPTPVLYAGDMTVLSTNPREVHLQESLSQLRDALQLQDDFFLAAEKRFSEIDSQNAIVSPAVYRTSQSTKDTKQDTKTNVACQLPVRSRGAFTPVTRTPSLPTTFAEKDPKTLKRRRALDYLSRIPSPPPLSQLSTRALPCVKKNFNPPRRSRTLSTLKAVQTPAPKPAPVEEGWVNDEELAMIDTQELRAADSLLD